MHRRFRSAVLRLGLVVGLGLGLWPLQALAQVTVSGSGSTKTVPNDPTVGTTRYSLARIDATGARLAQTTDTTRELWIVTAGEGTSQATPAVLAVTGDAPCTMDATLSNTRGMKVVISPTTDGRCHPQSTAPSTGYVIGIMSDNATTAGQPAIVSAQLINFSPGSGTGTGSVTSVGLAVPTGFTSTGGPITTSGNLTLGLATEQPNQVWAGPTTGAPAAPFFRALVPADLPAVTPGGTAGGGLAGSYPSPSVVNASGAFAYTGQAAVSTLSGTVNDFIPTGWLTNVAFPLDGGSADRTITGLSATSVLHGDQKVICNVGTTNSLILGHQNTGSSTANRMTLGTDTTLAPGVCEHLWYDLPRTTWRLAVGTVPDYFKLRPFSVQIGDPDPSSAPLAAGNDSPNVWTNMLRRDVEIRAVSCRADSSGSGTTVTPILTGQAANSILSGACTCTVGSFGACTLATTAPVFPIVHAATAGTAGATCPTAPCSVDVNLTTADGTTKQVTINVEAILK